MTKFVIGFVGRTGSSFLEGLLDSHPDAMCGPEIFSRSMDYDRSGLSFDDFLTGWGEGHQAAGFKLGDAHVEDRGEALGDALRRQGYKAILLRRENLLDQYISMRLAQVNDVWRSDMGTFKAQSFVADPVMAQASMQSFQDRHQMVRDFLHDLDHFDITYETIRERLPELQKWLGLTPAPLTSKYDRQRQSKTQREAIENYDEIAKALSGTEFERFLTSQTVQS